MGSIHIGWRYSLNFYGDIEKFIRELHSLTTCVKICDSYFNQFPVKVKLSSTVDTEPMILNIVDRKYYPKYPKIRQEDIGTDTSNKFIDTLNISNLFLNGIGGKSSPIKLLPLNFFNCWKLLRAS